MPILSVVSNSGLTAYNNKLSKVIAAYSNSGYSGKDPLFHATTAWVTAASGISNDFFFDAWLVAGGGGGSSGSPSGGITPGGGGGAGGYVYASGVQVGTGTTGMQIEVGMGRNTSDGKVGRWGGDTFIDAASLYAYGGGGGQGGAFASSNISVISSSTYSVTVGTGGSGGSSSGGNGGTGGDSFFDSGGGVRAKGGAGGGGAASSRTGSGG